MESSIITVLICTLVTCAGLIHAEGMQRIAGHVLYRHGDRTPVTTFPLDPVKPDEWPNGYGQLTAAGIEQQHRLGAYLRTRYGTLLSFTYHPSEFVIRSTDVDRTLMSAQSHLVGLYPAINATSDKVPIQPIPIHTVSISLDFLLGQNDCPRYDQLEEEVNESDDVKRMNAYYQPFFQQLQTWTGLVNITVYNAWDVADTVFVEHIYNRTPAWANEGVRQNLSDVNDLAFHYLFANNDTQRIRGGPLIQDIWMNMNNSVHGRSFHKVKMFSAHDTTVSAVLAFLGINYPHQPQYASALFVDLYQNGTSYFVQVDYLNVTDSNMPYPYVLDGCPASACPFETFADIYQPRFPSTADKECAKKEPPMPPMGGDSSTLIVVLVVSIVGLVSVIFVIFLCISLRKTDRDPPLIPFERSLQAL